MNNRQFDRAMEKTTDVVSNGGSRDRSGRAPSARNFHFFDAQKAGRSTERKLNFPRPVPSETSNHTSDLIRGNGY